MASGVSQRKKRSRRSCFDRVFTKSDGNGYQLAIRAKIDDVRLLPQVARGRQGNLLSLVDKPNDARGSPREGPWHGRAGATGSVQMHTECVCIFVRVLRRVSGREKVRDQ
jgi:hypothetical protein